MRMELLLIHSIIMEILEKQMGSFFYNVFNIVACSVGGKTNNLAGASEIYQKDLPR